MLAKIKSIWLTFTRLDYYRKAILLSLPIAGFLLIYLLISNPASLLLTEKFLDLITIPAFVGNIISGSSYVARSIDAYFSQAKRAVAGKWEKYGTMIGIGLGLAAGVALSVLHFTMPFATTLFGFANVIFTVTQISCFSGLGNRVGNCVDGTSRPKFENNVIAGTGLLGTIAAVLLVVCSAAAYISIAGVTSFFTGGALIPLWVSGFIFIGTFVGAWMSAADYLAKAINFVRTILDFSQTDKETILTKFHEYRGASIGVMLGIGIGTIAVAVLLITQPHLLAGIAGAVAAVMIITTSISVVGGLFSRIGRLIDGMTHAHLETQRALIEKQEKAHAAAPAEFIEIVKPVAKAIPAPVADMKSQALFFTPKHKVPPIVRLYPETISQLTMKAG